MKTHLLESNRGIVTTVSRHLGVPERLQTVVSGLFLFTVLFFSSVVAFAQDVIIDEPISTSLPSGWSHVAVSYQSATGGYARFDAENSVLETHLLDLSNYTNLQLTFEVAKFGSGNNGPLTVQVSDDGGATWTAQTYVSPVPTSSTYMLA